MTDEVPKDADTPDSHELAPTHASDVGAQPKKPFYEPTDDRKFQWYMERRKGYSSGARESYQRYDQTIATVSAGAIVLSITFLKDIGHTPRSLPWLIASWIAFLVAGGAGLLSLRTSADCDIEHLAALEALKGGEPYAGFEEKAAKLGQMTVRLNKTSVWSFLVGILLMMTFAYVNVSNLGVGDCSDPEKSVPAKASKPVLKPATADQMKSAQPLTTETPVPLRNPTPKNMSPTTSSKAH